ncbi:MAG: alanine racemase [Vulcanimicrobiaceae bacterium]
MARPQIGLDASILRANARAWARHARVPVRAVVKSDGYGWGAARIVGPLNDLVDAFMVADLAEFDCVRALTDRPIALLGDVPPATIGRVLDAGGIPTISSTDGLAAVRSWRVERDRPARVRVGLRPAVAWSGFDADELRALAPQFAAADCDLECWTHVTDPGFEAGQRAALTEAVAILRAAGARVVATDVESTLPLARQPSTESTVRIGVGLFGARLGAGPGELRCAIVVRAPLIRAEPARGQLVGYGTLRAPMAGFLAVVRCGYGDGFPRVRPGAAEPILSVGMQYAVLCATLKFNGPDLELLGSGSDIDALADAAGIAPQEAVVRLGVGANQSQ